MKPPPEQIGSFFLGAEYDPVREEILRDRPVYYDARDLTTHAVCIGMTGSGKTGLCVGLLEEAALDGVPAIIIDPKGDMGNLLLHFEGQSPADFSPWIDPDDARRKNLSKETMAQKVAEQWKEGLSSWGIGPDRIRRLDETVDFSVFTPGSTAGLPINVLGSLAAPAAGAQATLEELREQIQGTVAAVLSLIGWDSDPVKSREAIFLSVLFEHFWTSGVSLDIPTLITSIQDSPIRKFGVFDIDTFLPEQDRFKLAMDLNNLIAAPGFAPWLKGQKLDVGSLLYGNGGRARHSVFYIAHLSDQERMFFVTLLLQNVVAWMRTQPGTGSLRALLYFDEVFGFLPPVAQPPSKEPLLTILKQARAVGLGAVLVSQNPVDLDYKALGNAGTWFVGRLQSERDHERLLEGLKTASGIESSSSLRRRLSELRSRVFLLHNVHDTEPRLFHTRWVMNYLRGPLTRQQIPELPGFVRPVTTGSDETNDGPRETWHHIQAVKTADLKPEVAPDIEERFVAPTKPPSGPVQFRAAVGVETRIHFLDRKYDIQHDRPRTLALLDPAFSWDQAETLPRNIHMSTAPGAAFESVFGELPSGGNTARELKALENSLEDWLYHNSELKLRVDEYLKVCQRPTEDDQAFFGRLEQIAREKRDEKLDEAQEMYDVRLEQLRERLESKQATFEQREAEYEGRKQEQWIHLGEAALSVLFGGRSRRLGPAARKHRMTTSARQRMERAMDEVEDIERELTLLQAEAETRLQEIRLEWKQRLDTIATRVLRPRRTDVEIRWIGILWLPFSVDGQPLFSSSVR